jgi:hypothetical protein
VKVNGIELVAGQKKFQINGSFKTGEYLWYRGGDSIGVYDLNWNQLREIKVNSASFALEKTEHDFRIKTRGSSPFIEAQFFVKEKL